MDYLNTYLKKTDDSVSSEKIFCTKSIKGFGRTSKNRYGRSDGFL